MQKDNNIWFVGMEEQRQPQSQAGWWNLPCCLSLRVGTLPENITLGGCIYCFLLSTTTLCLSVSLLGVAARQAREVQNRLKEDVLRRNQVERERSGKAASEAGSGGSGAPLASRMSQLQQRQFLAQIKAHLGNSTEKFNQFRTFSNMFRKGSIDAEEVCYKSFPIVGGLGRPLSIYTKLYVYIYIYRYAFTPHFPSAHTYTYTSLCWWGLFFFSFPTFILMSITPPLLRAVL